MDHTKLILTLNTAVFRGQQVTIAYLDPSMNDDAVALQDAAGNDAENFYISSDAVTNLNPPASPGTPDLLSSDDSGRVDNDDVTKTNGFRVAVALQNGIAAGDTLVIARADDDSPLVSIVLTAVQVASGMAIVTIPPFTATGAEASLSTAVTGISIGLKARIEVPNESVAGTNVNTVSEWSGVLVVRLDIVASAPPAMVTVDTLEIMTIDGKDSFYSRTNRPKLEGIGEPFATVRLVANNVFLGMAVVGENGKWSFDTNASNLSDGSYAIELSATDTAGNISNFSAPFTLTIDTSSPESPRILMVEADTGLSAVDGVTKTRTVSLRGSSEPFTKINVYLQGTDGPIGTANSDRNGRWTFSYATGTSVISLTDGEYVFRATAADPSGNQSEQSPPFTLLVDNVAPGVPTIVALSPDTGVSSSDKLTKTNLIELRGTAELNTTVAIYRGTANSSTGAIWLGSVMTDPSGIWTFDMSPLNLAAGTHHLYARNVDLAGNEGAMTSQPYSVTIDVTAPNIVSNFALNGVAQATMMGIKNLALSGLAEPDSRIRIVLDGQPVGVTQAGSNGAWSFNDTSIKMSEGLHNLSLQVEDAAGNLSAPFMHVFTVDTIAPVAPIIRGLIAESDSGRSQTDGVTNHARPH